MRKKRNPQCRLNFATIPHSTCDELFSISRWLDAHPQFLDLVFDDLKTDAKNDTGRKALSAESVLRIALLRQYLQCDYDFLSFTLMDSNLFRHFCRLESSQRPGKSSLQSLITAISSATWESINRGLLGTAKTENIERGRTIAVDSTVSEADIIKPCDSDLLAASIKEMCRLLEKGQALTIEVLYSYTHHKRVVKKEKKACSYARKKEDQQAHYKKLLQLTRKTRKALMHAVICIKTASDKSGCLVPGRWKPG